MSWAADPLKEAGCWTATPHPYFYPWFSFEVIKCRVLLVQVIPFSQLVGFQDMDGPASHMKG